MVMIKMHNHTTVRRTKGIRTTKRKSIEIMTANTQPATPTTPDVAMKSEYIVMADVLLSPSFDTGIQLFRNNFVGLVDVHEP
jgi:hypothetical protein